MQRKKAEDDFRVAPLDGGKSLEITAYVGEKQLVNIPSRLHGRSVIKIGDGVFRGKELIDITIPNSVTEIGNRAFEGNMLTSITIPNSVTVIGDRAFAGNQLNRISIGSSVADIGEGAFRGNHLTSVTIPRSVAVIGANVRFGGSPSDSFPRAFINTYRNNNSRAGTYAISNGWWRRL